jgi:hypothetical protein
LRKARGFKVTHLVSMDQPFYTSLSRVVMPFAVKLLYTRVDTFALMDKTIVHELTHTFQALPSTENTKSDPYGRSSLLFHSHHFLPYRVATYNGSFILGFKNAV